MIPPLVFLLLWSASAYAVPTVLQQSEPELERRTLTVPVRANPNYISNGPAALAAAYQRWNMPVPESLAKHMLTRREGYSCNNDYYWLTDVFVGSEPQKLPVIIDTASSDFWLMTTDTNFGTAAVNGMPALYDPSKSGSRKEAPGATWESSYIDGSTSSGKVYFDTVYFGLMTDNNHFNIANVTIQSVVSVAPRWAIEPKISGVMGLAKSKPSSVKPGMPSMIDRLKPELHFEEIGIDLRPNSDKGFFSFGYSMGTADHQEPPMDDDEHWSFELKQTRTSSMPDKVWYRFTGRTIATIDTGSSFVLLPGDIVAHYYADIPDSAHDPKLEAWVFPCSSASSIPDMQFRTAGGYVGTISKESINLGPAPGNSEMCFGGIQGSGNARRAIFGGVALRSMYVQLNYGTAGSFVSFGEKGSLDVCSTTTACDV
ncbi:eukaryotic aspartyl protease [Colletotrichum orchidophilum]|uniref:Eukaryotic aspartyl protease n=1 Tax=Colletotrichum orchidophilum TaxID=1209926 RepID=A0A1G4AVQ0_9PEZI|nr:eukaryotic aspartyl protease [Colletotrichum orchidophilum]OHE93237.1 eukaryotic aspartyl protease [Colletotrichum orchidophilum]